MADGKNRAKLVSIDTLRGLAALAMAQAIDAVRLCEDFAPASPPGLSLSDGHCGAGLIIPGGTIHFVHSASALRTLVAVRQIHRGILLHGLQRNRNPSARRRWRSRRSVRSRVELCTSHYLCSSRSAATLPSPRASGTRGETRVDAISCAQTCVRQIESV